MSRFQDLRRKLGGQAPEEDPSMMEQTLDYLGRPGAAFRSGAHAAQKGEPIWEAAKRGFTSPTDEAPTGSDIADEFSRQTGVENPYVLGTLATMGDIADPAAMIPMVGPMAKIKNAEKILENAPDVANAFRKMSTAERIKMAKPGKFGKTIVSPSAQDLAEEAAMAKMGAPVRKNISELPEAKVETTLPEIFGQAETDELYTQFPELANKFRGKTLVVPKKLKD